MAIATDAEVQAFVQTRFRPRCEDVRAIVEGMLDDISAEDDVYSALTQATPTWTDTQEGAPPHYLTVADALAINAFWHDVSAYLKAHASYPIVLKACRTPFVGT